MPNHRQELVPVKKKGESGQWVDARTLHAFVESKQDFSNWISNYITDFGFIEGRDFTIIILKSTGGRRPIDYDITLDMAKHLAMLQRNEKGMQARQHFINAEKELRQLQAAMLAGYDEMDELLKQCKTRMHNGELYYAAGQLRAMAGKVSGSGFQYMVKQLKQTGIAVKLQDGLQWKWYVSKNGINRLLNVRPHNLLSVAIVKLLHHH